MEFTTMIFWIALIGLLYALYLGFKIRQLFRAHKIIIRKLNNMEGKNNKFDLGVDDYDDNWRVK